MNRDEAEKLVDTIIKESRRSVLAEDWGEDAVVDEANKIVEECRSKILAAITSSERADNGLPVIYCSFCGCEYSDERQIVLGPDVSICSECIRMVLEQRPALTGSDPKRPTIKIVCKEPPFHEVWLNDLVVIAVVRNEGTVDITGRWRKVEP